MSGRRILFAGALALGILAGAAGAIAQPALTSWSMALGTLTTGGTSQQALAANGARRAFIIQNPCTATESLWVAMGAAAVVGTSIELPPCAVFQGYGSMLSTGAVNVNAATTGHTFTTAEGT